MLTNFIVTYNALAPGCEFPNFVSFFHKPLLYNTKDFRLYRLYGLYRRIISKTMHYLLNNRRILM